MKVQPDEWIPLFTKYWPDEKILDPAFAITFDHCKLCDVHVATGEQKEHLRQHRRELRAHRAKQRRVQEQNLAKARKARAK